MVYKISIYDKNWKLVHEDFCHCEDRQAAELKAEADADWLGAAHYEVNRLR